jgi:hypothetical protein
MAKETRLRVCFLLGAGVSRPAGIPDTDEVTRAVLDTSGVVRQDDGRYCRNARFQTLSSADRKIVAAIGNFLHWAREYCQAYFNGNQKEREVNYEDRYYLAAQLHDHLSSEYENPAVQEFAKRVGCAVPVPDGVGLAELADEVCNYVQDTVSSQLSEDPRTLDHLGCLVEAARDPAVERCTIFTLNHDLVIERVLSAKGVAFENGFKPDGEEVAFWDSRLLQGAAKTKLLKLHGSVDWWAYRRESGTFRRTLFARVSGDPDHAHDGREQPLPIPLGMRPLLLLGTFNKMLDYTGGISADLFCLFRRILVQSRHLVVSGYSFRDKGVNRVLEEWLNHEPQNTLVLVHQNPEEAQRTARGAIRNPWNELLRRGQLRVVQSWFENTAWSDARSHLL